MPRTEHRTGRLHIPGGYYHVMGRGLERRRIFNTPEDKKDFLDRLSGGLEETACRCFAWVVMSNHYHLLIQVAATPLSKLMRNVLEGYAHSRQAKASQSKSIEINSP